MDLLETALRDPGQLPAECPSGDVPDERHPIGGDDVHPVLTL